MKTEILEKIEKSQIKKMPEIRPGDTVRVHQRISEGKKERIQVFEGVVLRVKGGGLRQSFIVRKISFGIGVERSFLINAPNIEKIEVKKRAKARRAYLTYLRNLTGKKARLKDKQFDSLVVNVQSEPEIIEEGSLSLGEAKDLASSAVTQNDSEDEKDADLTELDADKTAGIEEVPLSEVEKDELIATEAEDEIKEGLDESDHQRMEIEAIEEGMEEASKDIEGSKDKKGNRKEESAEEIDFEEIKEEIKREEK